MVVVSKAVVSMAAVLVRDAMPADFEAICALNLAELQHTSAMDRDRLVVLDRLACYHRVGCVDGRVAAFLLAMRDGAPYSNENFEWFSRRFGLFVYVDRVVVSSESRGRRLGSLLYEDLFRHARENDIPIVTCEYNLVPPNEPSRRFHDRFGFKEQGSRWAADGSKRVSLQSVVIS
jgi:predicted GNAT superfamily acetyltransferase